VVELLLLGSVTSSYVMSKFNDVNNEIVSFNFHDSTILLRFVTSCIWNTLTNGVLKASRRLTLIPYNLMLGLFRSLLVPIRLMLSVVGSNMETI
jgi:hypothetical protein